MHTVYDAITILMFAALVVLFLQRSAGAETPKDRVYQYLPPALGCALANWLGNEGQDVAAAALILAVFAYAFYVLKPFGRKG